MAQLTLSPISVDPIARNPVFIDGEEWLFNPGIVDITLTDTGVNSPVEGGAGYAIYAYRLSSRFLAMLVAPPSSDEIAQALSFANASTNSTSAKPTAEQLEFATKLANYLFYLRSDMVMRNATRTPFEAETIVEAAKIPRSK